MLPTLAVLASFRDKLGAYIVAQLGAPGWSLLLVKAPFVPNPEMTLGDLVIDTDIGNFPQPISDSGHFYGRDPASGDYFVQFFAGAGVQVLFSTGGTPKTEYGWVIRKQPGSEIIASELLPVPLQILTDEDAVQNPFIGFRLPMNLIR